MNLTQDQLQLLDALADGRLEGAELARAHTLVRENAEAAAIAGIHARIDEALRREFAPPATIEPSVPGRGALRVSPPRAAPSRRWVRWGLAAALLLTAAGAYLTHFVWVISPDSVFRELVAAGFEPSWKCKDDREFIEYATARTGTPFLIAQSAGVKVLGWDSATDLITDRTVCLMAESGTTPIVVYVDRLVDDHPLRLRPLSGMKLHRAEFDGCVFYEVSTLERPVILPLIYRPSDVPGAGGDTSGSGGSK